MEIMTFFLKQNANYTSLAEIAEKVFNLLRLQEWEERSSSNYPNEHYFVAYAENAKVQVSDNDLVGMSDLPFRVTIKNATWQSGSGTIITDPPSIARILASGGLSVFIPRGAWYRTDWDGDGDLYSPD
jgi:hypothetical protein